MSAPAPSPVLPAAALLHGVAPAAAPAILEEMIRTNPAPVWIGLLESQRKAEQLAREIPFYHALSRAGRPLEVLVLPEDLADSRSAREAFAAASERLAVLSLLRGRAGRSDDQAAGTVLLLTTPAALLQPVPALEAFSRNELTLAAGEHRPFSALVEQLVELDYDSEAVCEAPGQYAVRGGIIDIYPAAGPAPYRLDFFGDELESIRELDPVTQRSGRSVAGITLSAAPGAGLAGSEAGLAEYLGERAHFAVIDPAAVETAFAAVSPDEDPFDALEEFLRRRAQAQDSWFALADLEADAGWFEGAASIEAWRSESLEPYRPAAAPRLVAEERLMVDEQARENFLLQVAAWKKQGFRIYFVLSKEAEAERTREILREHPELKKLAPAFRTGILADGFKLDFAPEGPALTWKGVGGTAGIVVVTETEIFGRRRRPPAFRRPSPGPSQVDQMLDFSELVEGDHVVHLQHGIAVYRGITRLEFQGQTREVISLEFEDRVTLHVPLQESHLITRYVGVGKTRPQLGKIGSGRWEKTRQAAERATLDMAAELLEIQAKRNSQPGFPFPPDNAWQKEFEAAFPYTETPDQLKAILASKADMEQTRPMDRLICGDVGFGKTEVAIRAAFKAVMAGKQAAVLVPTTVLAQQHLNTFRERMAGYPIVVEVLSRFRTRQEQKRIIEALARGGVDILIGTHRLIQADVAFRDLGLVVIDEEQRFGVKHKEVFKRWRQTVDVLSMSATPIPRTLYLALTGARDLSVIETPPADRHPIHTVVKQFDPAIVTDAIRREIRRGGQVFYLHNRVQTIDFMAQKLAEMLPDVSIGVGHGQMGENRLERVMTEFVAGRYQVLVCTTIIESGLDIPNCNTIIIEGADRFGLSQLYQLRGRVGRFKHQAYAYLLLHRHSRVLDIARQRLNALRQHNQLGAGFRIAMRDLELRGAGNLLGAEQSGHIVGVGFDLYCQLLRQSVARLKGEASASTVRATVKLDFVFIGEGEEAGRRRYEDGYTVLKEAEIEKGSCPRIQARLPAAYLPETRLRIDFYRRLAMAENAGRVREIGEELRDRFGACPEAVKALLLVTEIRCRAEEKGILLVETEGNRLKCLRNSGRKDDFVMLGTRFPRLTAPKPILRLREILVFLQNLSTA